MLIPYLSSTTSGIESETLYGNFQDILYLPDWWKTDNPDHL